MTANDRPAGTHTAGSVRTLSGASFRNPIRTYGRRTWGVRTRVRHRRCHRASVTRPSTSPTGSLQQKVRPGGSPDPRPQAHFLTCSPSHEASGSASLEPRRKRGWSSGLELPASKGHVQQARRRQSQARPQGSVWGRAQVGPGEQRGGPECALQREAQAGPSGEGAVAWRALGHSGGLVAGEARSLTAAGPRAFRQTHTWAWPAGASQVGDPVPEPGLPPALTQQHPHLVDVMTEAQEGGATCPRPRSWGAGTQSPREASLLPWVKTEKSQSLAATSGSTRQPQLSLNVPSKPRKAEMGKPSGSSQPLAKKGQLDVWGGS